MTGLIDVFPILAILSFTCAFLIFSYLLITERKSPRFSTVDRSETGGGVGKPKLSIIVTAKDEEQLILDCLNSLLSQTYTNFHVIVVDDSSTDHTSEIVRNLVAKDSKLKLVEAGPKPVGWAGKSWPCWRGYEESASADYLLFVDADSTFEKTVAERSIHLMEDKSIDVFSLSPHIELCGIWALAVLPLISGAINLLYPMIKVNDSKSDRAYVFGTYFLVRKTVYETTGGHRAVKDQLVEDAAVARMIKSAGFNLKIERGPEFVSTHWESDLKTIFHGMERIISSSAKGLGIVSMLNAPFLFFLIVYPVVYVFASILSRMFTGILLLGLIASLLNVIVFVSLYALEMESVSGRAGLGFFLYFLGGLIFIGAIVTTSLKIRTGKKLMWKGQGYSQASGVRRKEIIED